MIDYEKLSGQSVLITGGAGFIGSHIAGALAGKVKKLMILDNLSTGSLANISQLIANGTAKFTEGSICDEKTCMALCENTDIVIHQAALGSVPRSIENPRATHETNVDGFINMLEAARLNGVRRFIYASSSSVYGDNESLPKTENNTGNPLSPYAVSKKTNELYAKVYGSLYKMEIIGLRYFNVFGPRQSPEGPYAAVIPIFIKNILSGKPCNIFGDGENRRDFTYVDNVVQANLLAATTSNAEAYGEVLNIAYGSTKSVNALFSQIRDALSSKASAVYHPPRVGEIKDSFASIEKARRLIGYNPQIDLDMGIELAIDWYRRHYGNKS